MVKLDTVFSVLFACFYSESKQYSYQQSDRIGQSRNKVPKGIIMRKVRASQGKDNG